MKSDSAFSTLSSRRYRIFKRLNGFLAFLCMSGKFLSNLDLDLFSELHKWLFVVRVHILLRNDCPNHEVSAHFRMFTFFILMQSEYGKLQ